MCITKTEKAESEAQRGKPKGGCVDSVLLKRKKQKARPRGVNLKVRWRAKVAMRYCSEESAHRAILVWECRDRPQRRSVGKGACVCVHVVTIQHRGWATRSFDHDREEKRKK